jgi:hypothetical protein
LNELIAKLVHFPTSPDMCNRFAFASEDNIQNIPQAGIIPEHGRADNEDAKWHPYAM